MGGREGLKEEGGEGKGGNRTCFVAYTIVSEMQKYSFIHHFVAKHRVYVAVELHALIMREVRGLHSNFTCCLSCQRCTNDIRTLLFSVVYKMSVTQYKT